MLSCRFRVDEKRKNTISHLLCSRCAWGCRSNDSLIVAVDAPFIWFSNPIY